MLTIKHLIGHETASVVLVGPWFYCFVFYVCVIFHICLSYFISCLQALKLFNSIQSQDPWCIFCAVDPKKLAELIFIFLPLYLFTNFYPLAWISEIAFIGDPQYQLVVKQLAVQLFSLVSVYMVRFVGSMIRIRSCDGLFAFDRTCFVKI